MARPKLSSPDQPLLVRGLLRTYEALASLKLAVLLIVSLAVTLAWATQVDSWYGFKAAHFAVYGTSWFAALIFLLGANVLCAALIRFPWKRYQTGFVITHAGILVLLAGCLLTRLGGIDAQMPIFEGGTAHQAFQDTQRFDLTVFEPSPGNSSGSSEPAQPRTIRVPFAAGPFNWEDYGRLFPFPWRLAHRDQGVLYDHDGIRLEVLDYLSDSALRPVPPLRVALKSPSGDSWQTIELAARSLDEMRSSDRAPEHDNHHELAGGERIVFWSARSSAETEAFLDSKPEGPAPAPKAKSKEQEQPLRSAPRQLDLLEGADGRLYYRVWNAPQIEAIGPVPVDKKPIVSFQGSGAPLTWYVDRFTPSDRPGSAVTPLPYSAKKEGARKQRRALVRLTVDGRSEEFWLDGIEPNPLVQPLRPDESRTVPGDKRRVAVSLAWDSFDLGFDVYLHQFDRRLDPGTSMASHYSSLVDFCRRVEDREGQKESPSDTADSRKPQQAALLGEKVLITLNEPKTIVDPRDGRSYRMFQESFNGPWKPGDEEFDMLVQATSDRDQLFVSTLTVNYDPGRGLKYLGSLLVVGGVVTMFYMKAYFFKRRGPA